MIVKIDVEKYSDTDSYYDPDGKFEVKLTGNYRWNFLKRCFEWEIKHKLSKYFWDSIYAEDEYHDRLLEEFERAGLKTNELDLIINERNEL